MLLPKLTSIGLQKTGEKFSNESTVQQFASRKRLVRRPLGARYEDRYTIQTMKLPPSIMVWGAMFARGTAGLSFLQPDTSINGTKYRVSPKIRQGLY